MKKIITYFLISVYLLSFQEVRQLMKVPTLIEHYISHRLRDENTTLFSFIKMHYLDAPVKDSDYSQDMKLPFKTQDVSTSMISLITPPKRVEIAIEKQDFTWVQNHHFIYSESYYPSVFQKIWQPPKI